MKNSRAHPNYLTAALNPYVIIYAMASILSLVSRNAHFLIEVERLIRENSGKGEGAIPHSNK